MLCVGFREDPATLEVMDREIFGQPDMLQAWIDEMSDIYPRSRVFGVIVPWRERRSITWNVFRMVYRGVKNVYPTSLVGRELGCLPQIDRYIPQMEPLKKRLTYRPMRRDFMTDASKLSLVIDGHNIMIRAKYSVGKQNLATSRGEPSGMLFGTIVNFLSIMRQMKPDYVVWSFDYGKSKERVKRYPAYKSSRANQREQSPEDQADFQRQYDALLEFLDICGFKWYRERGVESDDTIAKITRNWQGNILIVTSDHDMFQLINERVLVLNPGKQTAGIPVLDADSIKAKYGLPPHRLAELTAIVGDKSDDIEGVRGIGPVKGAKLLQDKTLDQVLEEDAALDQPKLMINGSYDQVIDNYFLADLLNGTDLSGFNIPHDDCKVTHLDDDTKKRLADFFEHWEFDSLYRQLQEGVLY